jgi:hypothetical protein
MDGCFQQHGANARNANNSVRVLRELFDDRTVRTGLWPPRSDLSVYDLYVRGNLKGKLYGHNPLTAESLQNEMRNVIASIAGDEPQGVS